MGGGGEQVRDVSLACSSIFVRASANIHGARYQNVEIRKVSEQKMTIEI